MLEKNKMAKELRMLKEEIKFLERKRSRSQASLIDAIVNNTEPDKEELQYFRAYTAEIEVKREQLQSLDMQLKRSKR